MVQKSMNEASKTEETATQVEGPRIHWDQAKMKTTYANVCNVSSTREEVSILFGTNQTVNVAQNGITVELTDRIILNPYAAKRLANILTGVLQQYEAAFGPLPID
jgi:phage-related minor tail protein